MGWDAEDVALLKKLWAAGRSAAQIARRLGYILENPQYRARGNIQMKESRAGPLAVLDVVACLSETPGHISWLGEGLGLETTRYSRGCSD